MLPVYLIHWNAPEWCRRAVESVEKSEPPVAVTVIDNGGAPLDVAARVLRQAENRGYTGGANAALEDWLAGDEPWAVIGSHDLHVEPHTFAAMRSAATPDVGIVGPSLAAGSEGGRTPDGEVEWLSGTCLMIRRECAEQVGPFDETFGSYVEDVDYCFRARAAGWRLLRTDAPATGLGTSIGRSSSRRLIRGRSLYLRYKHGGAPGALREVRRAARYAGAAGLHGRWSDVSADVRGLVDGLTMCWRAARRSRRRSEYDRLGLMILAHTTDHLDECLGSIADQTVTPSAIVLVDNGSGTDAVRDLARRYDIPTIRLDVAVTPSAARNIGCSALADCDLIVNLDGDDLIKPRFVDVYWSTARNTQADVVFGAAELIGAQTGVAFTREQLGPTPDLRRRNHVPANSLFKRRLWRDVGGFDPSVVYFEDWDFWLSLSERGAIFEHVDEPLWCYRRHEHSRMAAGDTDEQIRSKRIIHQKHRRHMFGFLQWRRVLWKVTRD